VISVAEQLGRAERYLGTLPGAAERAMARALNQAGQVGRAAAVPAITGIYAAKASDVREMLAVSKATPDELEVTIRARSRSLTLGYFPHTPTAPGTGGPGQPALTAEIRKGSVKAVAGAFVANLNSGPRVMVRTGGKTGSGKAAIRGLFSVPLATMLANQAVRDQVEVAVVAELDRRLDPEIDRELAKAGAR
jgi:hypothetical protein